MNILNNYFYNNRPFFEKFTKELTLILPAQEIKPIPPLSPIIAQFGLNAAEVCDKFNKASIIFPPGLLIPVSIFYIPKEKTFDLCFRPIQLKFLLQQFILFNQEKKRYQIKLLDLYKVFLIKSNILNLNYYQTKIYFRNIIGTLKSYDHPVEILFENSFNNKKNSNNIINLNNILHLLSNFEIPIIKKIENNIQINEEQEEKFDIKFGIRKTLLYKNKKRFLRKIEKEKKRIAFNIWSNLPFSLLLYTPKIKDYHYMKRFLYKLNDSIIIRKQRFFYKKNYDEKLYTNFYCYRIYSKNIYELYSIMEHVLEYNINIFGLELHKRVYSINTSFLLLKTLKNSLKNFFDIFNQFNNILNSSVNNIIKLNYNPYLENFLYLCQHIHK
jgi:ribosomal protein L11